jgi:hypothetical protein
MPEKIIKALAPEDIDIREINEKTRTIWHRISKEVKDRMGDIVRIDGIDTKNFRKKPTVLYGHNYAGLDPIPVIGSNIGFRKEGKSYYAGTRFLNPEEEKLSGKLADLVNDAWVLSRMKLIGWSIGFIPKETVPLKEKVAETEEEVTTGLDFKKSELLEYSLVLIPANQEAINDAVKKGLVTKGVIPEVQPEPQLVDDLTADLADEDDDEAATGEASAPCLECREKVEDMLAIDDNADKEQQQADELADLIERMGVIVDDHIAIRKQVISILKEKYNKEKKN